MTPSLTFSFQDGQLGFGGRSRRFNARPVARLGAAVDIRAGGSHTCALEVGERSSGTASPKKEMFNILWITTPILVREFPIKKFGSCLVEVIDLSRKVTKLFIAEKERFCHPASLVKNCYVRLKLCRNTSYHYQAISLTIPKHYRTSKLPQVFKLF